MQSNQVLCWEILGLMLLNYTKAQMKVFSKTLQKPFDALGFALPSVVKPLHFEVLGNVHDLVALPFSSH